MPCLLAGGRDEIIGTDVLTYAKWMCENAQVTPFLDFLIYESEVAAVGWNIFTWVSVRLLGGLPGYLFAIEALCIVPVYLAIRKLFKEHVWLGMLIWLLLCYAFTLNGMRQSVAMGFVFYSIVFVIERRPYAFILGIMIAISFHQTALVGLLLYPFSSLVTYGKGMYRLFGKWKWLVITMLTIICFAMLFTSGAWIVQWASFLKDSYSYQAAHLGENDFSLAGLYLLLMVLICWAISRNDFARNRSASMLSRGEVQFVHLSTMYTFISGVIIIGCLAWQLNYVASTLGRIGYYGSMFIPLFGVLLASNKITPRKHLALLIIATSVYFIVMILLLGKEGVFPYSSNYFGIT